MDKLLTQFSARIYGKIRGKKVQETLDNLEKEDEKYENHS